jgi:UDP-N-acetylmuramoyl-tripeptide--D-alanyl-D-alanine ligase
MIGRILSQAGETLVSAGNLNNHIGVPLSLLRLRASNRYAVIEMGMNHAGELTVLSNMAAPSVAIVNNAAPAHLEGLGSVERVAAAKGEIFSGLGAAGTAVINADDHFADFWRGLNSGRRVVTFGLDRDADVRGEADVRVDHSLVRISYRGAEVSARVPVSGAHNARNAVAAAAVAFVLDVEPHHIAAGLESFRPVAGRGEVVTLPSGARLIDDSYNANPASLRAAIEMLAQYSGTRVLVMGDMAELGEQAAELHRESGNVARRAGIDRVLGFGPNSHLACEAFGEGAEAFDRVEDLAAALGEMIDEKTTVLVKGSRSMRMERIREALVRAGDGGAGGKR